jgi:glycosyltransferase involved in cell wall biosynthesis
MTVSVIVPALNAENFIEKALQSLQAQSYKDLEIILVDNGSTDQTLSIMEKFAEEQSRVIVISELRKGSAYARNAGLMHASGDWVQFLDADDVLGPNKIENQVLLGLQQEANIVVGNFILKKGIFKLKKKCVTDDVWVALISSQLGITSSILWRRDIILKVGGWDNHIQSSQEYHLLFKSLKIDSTKIAFDNSFNTIVFEQTESISKSKNEAKRFVVFEDNYKLRKEIMLYLCANLKSTTAREMSFNLYKRNLLLWSLYDCRLFYTKLASENKALSIEFIFKVINVGIKRIFVFSINRFNA